MKILLLTTHLDHGGITAYTVTLARGLSRRGHEVLCASGGGGLVSRLHENGLEHLRVPLRTKSEVSPRVLISAFILGKAVREKGIQIVHAQTRVAQVTAHIVSRLTGIPYVSTCHGFFKTRLSRRLFPGWGDRVIAISEEVRAHLTGDFRVADKDVRVIHNGVEAEKFPFPVSAEEKRSRKIELGLPPEKKLVGIIARLSPVKGHEHLLRAAGIIAARMPETRFLIVGDGPEREKLLKLRSELGLEDRMVFRPGVDDTSRALAAMDVFAFPSLSEGLGLALLEAMACGLPVAASDEGGIKSVVDDGENGLLVPSKDPGALAEAIMKLLDEEGFAGHLGRNARETVERRFSLDRMIDEVESLYGETIAGQKKKLKG